MRPTVYPKLIVSLLLLINCASVIADTSPRLVVLAPDLARNLIMLGAADQIRGIISNDSLEQQLTNAEVVGDHQLLNFEKILSLKPSKIIAWQGGNPESQLQRLEGLGLEVVRVRTERLADLPAQLRTFGQILGREAQAQLLIDQFYTAMDALQVKSQPDVRLFYELWHAPLMSVNDHSWISEIFSLCGAINVLGRAYEPYPQVGEEAVLAGNVQVILGSSELPSNWQESWQKWPQIPAVAADQLYTVDADYLHQLTLDTVRGAEQVCAAVERARRIN